MKRILVYVIILVQIAIISIFVYQFEQIDVTGTEIKITTKEKDEFDNYDFPLYDAVYVEYDISIIPEEKWTGQEELKYGEKVFVLLEKGNDGIYVVNEASDQKLENSDTSFVLVPATYGYYNETEKSHEINYKFQHIDKVNRFGSFNYLDDLVITLNIGKWGQYKVVDVSLQGE